MNSPLSQPSALGFPPLGIIWNFGLGSSETFLNNCRSLDALSLSFRNKIN